MNLKQFMELTRINHGYLVAIAILVGEIITIGAFPDLIIFIKAVLTGVLIQTGSFTIGDYWDLATDKANKRFDRPLARGDVNPKMAVLIAGISFVLGLIIAATINTLSFYVAFLFLIIGIAYGYYLKKVALIGNFATAASMAVPFIFGAVAHDAQIPLALWILAALAFAAGTGRELIKGVQDYEGDKKTGRKTFAIAAGRKAAVWLGFILIIIAVLISFLPFLWIAEYMGDYLFLLLVIINGIIWIYSGINALELKNFEKIRKFTLIGQFTGVIAFLIGAII